MFLSADFVEVVAVFMPGLDGLSLPASPLRLLCL